MHQKQKWSEASPNLASRKRQTICFAMRHSFGVVRSTNRLTAEARTRNEDSGDKSPLFKRRGGELNIKRSSRQLNFTLVWKHHTRRWLLWWQVGKTTHLSCWSLLRNADFLFFFFFGPVFANRSYCTIKNLGISMSARGRHMTFEPGSRLGRHANNNKKGMFVGLGIMPIWRAGVEANNGWAEWHWYFSVFWSSKQRIVWNWLRLLYAKDEKIKEKNRPAMYFSDADM